MQTEALTLAANNIFMASAGVFVLAGALVWLAPRPKGPVDLSAAH